MTKDFKISGASASGQQYGISWVLGGIAVGLLVGAVIYATAGSNKTPVADAATANSTVATTAQTGNNNPATNTASAQDKPAAPVERPDFSYHAILPQLEVPLVVGDSSKPVAETPAAKPVEKTEKKPEKAEKAETVATAKPAQESAEAITGDGRYLFQLGAYKTQDQAAQMQRRASSSGLNTRIETSKVNGETWYRVRLGPTADLQTANKWKQRLAGMGISAMMIRL